MRWFKFCLHARLDHSGSLSCCPQKFDGLQWTLLNFLELFFGLPADHLSDYSGAWVMVLRVKCQWQKNFFGRVVFRSSSGRFRYHKAVSISPKSALSHSLHWNKFNEEERKLLLIISVDGVKTTVSLRTGGDASGRASGGEAHLLQIVTYNCSGNDGS